jgi:hypothetical protein
MFLAKNFPSIRKKIRGEEFSGEKFSEEENQMKWNGESSSEEISGNRNHVVLQTKFNDEGLFMLTKIEFAYLDHHSL